jgi:hypothetical protein
VSGPALSEGVEPIDIDGVQVPVFNANKSKRPIRTHLSALR